MKKSRYILPVLVALTCCLWPEAAAAADMTQTGRIAAEAAAVDKITVTQEVTVDPAATLNIRSATPSQSGLMSPAQAAQLEAMAVGGGGGISAESDPVYSAEKAAIYAALDERVMESDLATYAPLDSPALTGSPTTTEPPADSNDTTIATTAFVKANAAGGSGGVSLIDTITSTRDYVLNVTPFKPVYMQLKDVPNADNNGALKIIEGSDTYLFTIGRKTVTASSGTTIISIITNIYIPKSTSITAQISYSSGGFKDIEIYQ